jgi:hypothetical protein
MGNFIAVSLATLRGSGVSKGSAWAENATRKEAKRAMVTLERQFI